MLNTPWRQCITKKLLMKKSCQSATGYTTAFRREAGTYGKDSEGFFRLHQFNKLEMESFTTAGHFTDEHLLMIGIQEHLMQTTWFAVPSTRKNVPPISVD